jgi:hypothetical protein
MGRQAAIKRHLIPRSAWQEAAIRKDAARCDARQTARPAALQLWCGSLQRPLGPRDRSPNSHLVEASQIDLTFVWY